MYRKHFHPRLTRADKVFSWRREKEPQGCERLSALAGGAGGPVGGTLLRCPTASPVPARSAAAPRCSVTPPGTAAVPRYGLLG